MADDNGVADLFAEDAPAGSPERNGHAPPERNPIDAPEPYKRCGAKKRDGTPCRAAAMPNGRCRLHGGKTPGGIASPHFKHGRRSRYLAHLCGNLAAGFRAAMSDPRLLELSEDVALVTARIGEQLAKGKDDPAAVAGVWEELPQLLNLRAKLALAEQQRATEAQALVPVEWAVAFAKAMMLAAKTIIHDDDVLRELQRRTLEMLPKTAPAQPVEYEPAPNPVAVDAEPAAQVPETEDAEASADPSLEPAPDADVADEPEPAPALNRVYGGDRDLIDDV